MPYHYTDTHTVPIMGFKEESTNPHGTVVDLLRLLLTDITVHQA